MVAITITAIICATVLLIYIVDKVAFVADRKNFYNKCKSDEVECIFIEEEVKKNGD